MPQPDLVQGIAYPLQGLAGDKVSGCCLLLLLQSLVFAGFMSSPHKRHGNCLHVCEPVSTRTACPAHPAPASKHASNLVHTWAARMWAPPRPCCRPGPSCDHCGNIARRSRLAMTSISQFDGLMTMGPGLMGLCVCRGCCGRMLGA